MATQPEIAAWGWGSHETQCDCDEPGCPRDFIDVVPINDLCEHDLRRMCWCKPTYDGSMIVHNAADGREAFERGERKLS